MITGGIMMVVGTMVPGFLGWITHRVTLVPWMPVHIRFME
jgi:hypothetical protein